MDTPDPITCNNDIVVLFDGVCNLCNGAVQFIIRRNARADIRFASLQSPFGTAQLVRHGLDPQQLHSIIVVKHETVLERSDAVLEILRHLDSPWPVLTIFRFWPRFFRDGLYNLVARSRYKIFGRTDACMLPTATTKTRFIS